MGNKTVESKVLRMAGYLVAMTVKTTEILKAAHLELSKVESMDRLWEWNSDGMRVEWRGQNLVGLMVHNLAD